MCPRGEVLRRESRKNSPRMLRTHNQIGMFCACSSMPLKGASLWGIVVPNKERKKEQKHSAAVGSSSSMVRTSGNISDISLARELSPQISPQTKRFLFSCSSARSVPLCKVALHFTPGAKFECAKIIRSDVSFYSDS